MGERGPELPAGGQGDAQPSKHAEILARGLVSFYQPAFEESRDHIEEMLNGQNRLLKIMEQENVQFKECEFTYNIPELMQQVRTYHGKLVKVKKQMTGIHDRCGSLKRRSLRLKEQTEARAKRAWLDGLRARERDEQLVAKFAGPHHIPE